MAIIIAIDPGNIYSGYAVLNTAVGFPGEILLFGKKTELELKHEVLQLMSKIDMQETEVYFAIEMVASYGMAVGQTVFDTCAKIGRFEQFFDLNLPLRWKRDVGDPEARIRSHRIYRKKTSELGIPATTMELCKTTRAKDTNIRQAVIDVYPGTGGGRIPQIGSKADPGPLYGISKDVWSAMAVGLTMQKWLTKPVPKPE